MSTIFYDHNFVCFGLWVVVPTFVERSVLIFDVQFPEYLSITVLTSISISMKISSSSSSFILLCFREHSRGLVNPSSCTVVGIVGFVLGFFMQ